MGSELISSIDCWWAVHAAGLLPRPMAGCFCRSPATRTCAATILPLHEPCPPVERNHGAVALFVGRLSAPVAERS